MDVSYRKIAKALAHGMPIEGQEYSELIESYIKSIEAMPLEQRAALQAAYIFSRKTPKEEWQDLFQHFVAHGLKILSKWREPIQDIAGFCYVVVRNEWKRVTRERKRHIRMLNGGFLSLNVTVGNTEDEDRELLDTIADDLDLETELNSKLDSQVLLDTLPYSVKAIVKKRLLGDEKISTHEYEKLARYREENGKAIRELIRA